MAQRSAADFLIRTVLDETFRELALADPKRAFEGYALTEEQQEILRSRDARLLGLLGGAASQGETLAEHAPKEGISKTADAPLPGLPQVKLLLRLVPQATQTPDSASRVAYAASLHSWPRDEESPTIGAESGGQTAGDAADLTPRIEWVVCITPTVVDSQESGLKVAYAASIQPLAVGTNAPQPSIRKPSQALGSPPWNHQVESSAARAAARAVRASEANGRYEKLLELIHALQTGDERG